jgi:hypothetical protein
LGASVFQFKALEELEKKPEQSDREFNEELELLRQLWVEKFDPLKLY